MSAKNFFLKADQIKPLAQGLGGCIATDRIVVDGRPVGYMYREEPKHNLDSGWRFFAGDEQQDYIDDLNHSGVYDVNTIANYDPQIIPFLKQPLGAAFIRDEASGRFVSDGERPN